MMVIGRSDNMALNELGLPANIVSKLAEYNITRWEDLVINTLGELQSRGFSNVETSQILDVVKRNCHREER